MASVVEVDGQTQPPDDLQKLNGDTHESGVAEDTLDHPHVNGVGKGENGTTEHASDHEKDDDASDAQAQVIISLRSQVTDLFTQVTQLNSKLVSSYDRVSDLEDQMHVSSASLRNATLQVSELELERTQHLAALNTGLLVEREHVTAELNRLMERATLEAAQRGQAESAKHDIEKDLDDLSASLFDQANTMVAEARFAAAQSERKAGDAEEALRTAEEAVRAMQTAMQDLMADRENARTEAERARIRMGKGKWVDRGPGEDGMVLERQLRLMNTHQPFTDFLSFVGHLRSLRASGNAHPPAMSSLLSLPFPARLLTEDSEPTLRLDLAPSLNWLTRRSVLAAIHTGMLSIEPIPLFSLLQEVYPHIALPSPPSHPSHSYAENNPLPANVTLSCALCGTSILPPPTPPGLALGSDGKDRPQERRSSQNPLTSLTLTRNLSSNSAAWLRGLTSTNSNSNLVAEETSSSPTATEAIPVSVPEQIFIFRLNTQSSSIAALASTPFSASSPPPSHPAHLHPPASPRRASSSAQSIRQLSTVSPARTPGVQQQQQPQQATPYPLCASNYCLTRMRSTCSLWAFVRSGIVEHVWEEPVSLPPHAQTQHAPVVVPGSPPTRPSTPGRDRDSQKGISFGFGGGSPGKQIAPPPSHPSTMAAGSVGAAAQNGAGGEKAPPVPPRRRGLWGMASALGEALQERGKGRAGSRWGSRDVSADHSARASGESGGVELVKDGLGREGKGLPPPPPSHPDVPHERNTDRKPVPSVPDDLEAMGEKKMDEGGEKDNGGEPAEHEEHEHGHVQEETLFDAGHEHGHHEHEHEEMAVKEDEAKQEEKETSTETLAASEDRDNNDGFVTPPDTDDVPAQQALADNSSLATPPATPGADQSSFASASPAVRKSLDLSAATNAAHMRSLDAGAMPSPGAVPLPPSRADSPAPNPTGLANGGEENAIPAPAPQGAAAPPPVSRRAAARRPAPTPPGALVAAPEPEATPVAGEKEVEAVVEESEDTEVGELEADEVAQAHEDKGADKIDVDRAVEPAAEDVEMPATPSEAESELTFAPVPGATSGNVAEVAVKPEDESKPEVKTEVEAEKEVPPDSGFTTDATWEERTWREVVRLREEMFWARVGGVR
ncbi:hypothetical protein CONPUDRAFT_167588 [Coniophora puteana RWD-64-598 SS2]|uniref:GDP/GTP exchange factor Sec2 N-terminal domain-containing protein n=1 Tax=Coniophora puteana (strain RWD-64-598) TaxID=741705 RepID=A0A5M3MIK5_CONPW|nr:uncharacterized protein CONPUDRAFT_167588 [Coniophora puteana RWD-64-598 SS2]EIW78614.1 hypothetical protein CONPUDRAFT_167588 [Coniophora puteana RWD-64-598 SS2]